MSILDPNSDAKNTLKIASLVEAEEAFLAKARTNANSAYFSQHPIEPAKPVKGEPAKGVDPLQRPHNRRHFLASFAVLASSSVAGRAIAQTAASPDGKAPPGAVWRSVPEDATKIPGAAIGEDGGYGTRSQFETEVRWRFGTKPPSLPGR